MNTTTKLAHLSFIEEQNLNTAEKYFYFAAAVLLLYDFLLTIGAERACFWRRRLSGAAALFLTNRYLTLFLALYNAPWWDVLQLEDSGTAHTRCTTVAFVQAFFLNSQYVIWAVFNCLRVYALQRPRWRCTAIVLVLSLTVVAADVVQLPSVHSTLDRAPLSAGCAARDNTPLQGFYSAEISVCILLIAAELLVMTVSWAEMAHYRASARRVRRALTLSCVLYENGRAYFVSVTLMHMLHLLSPLLSFVVPRSPARAPDLMNLSLILFEPIIAILVNRFLLALQAAASTSAPQPDDTLSNGDSAGLLQFVRADVDEWIQSELDFASPSSLDDTTSTVTSSVDGEAGARWDAECEAVLQRIGSAERVGGAV